MKIQIKKQDGELEQIVCNGCKRLIHGMNEAELYEEYLHIEKTWGYFSKQDGQKIAFDLCEQCVNDLLKRLCIPAYQEEEIEFL